MSKLIKIRHRYSEKVIISGNYESMKDCLKRNQDANLRGADLQGANLQGASLRSASLQGANLQGASLRSASLRGASLQRASLRSASLQGANLQGAFLQGVDLQGVDLQDADLRGASLQRANLRGADLRGASLQGANLRGADLRGASLQGANGINPYLCTPLLMLLEQPDNIRAYKIVNNTNEGIYRGGIQYIIGKTVEAEKIDLDITEQCSFGISLATLDWCMREWEPGYKILICEFPKTVTVNKKKVSNICIPTATDGKFRVKKCKVVKNVNLKKIGLEASC